MPVLVCEDDYDLSCIVIMAKIRKKEPDTVYWDSLGKCRFGKPGFQIEKQSGILYLKHTDQDWENRGIT